MDPNANNGVQPQPATPVPETPVEPPANVIEPTVILPQSPAGITSPAVESTPPLQSTPVEDVSNQPETPPKKSNKLLIIISVLVVLLLIGGGVAAYILTSSKNANDSSQIEDEEVIDEDLTTGEEETSISYEDKDAERAADMSSLQGQLAVYFAANKLYPTLDTINNPEFRTANLLGLYDDALIDPDGIEVALVAVPAKGAYSYNPLTSDSKPCDNSTKAKQCTKYSLTATKHDGTTIVKQPIN